MFETVRFQAPCQRFTVAHVRGGRHLGLMLVVLSVWQFRHEQAHAEPGRIELGVTVAPSLDTHAGRRRFSQNTYKQGWSAGAALRYELSHAWSFQAELLHATRGTNVESGGELFDEYNFRYLQVPLLARYGWLIPGPMGGDGRPLLTGYLLVGPALGFVLRAEDLDDERILPRSSVRSFDVTVTAGLGVTWRFTPRWAAFVEARFDRGFVDAFSTGVESNNQAFLLALGVGYPLNDGDRDGVANSRDRCPTGGEDWNGYQDADGCPDDDNDKDGVAVVNDQCLEEAEDRDGFDDTDGCPDLDNDGDTILDEEDYCPDESFPYNKALPHNRRGCPPELDRVQVKFEDGRLELTPPLEFDKYVHTIDKNPDGPHVKTLDQVAELLERYYPDMRLRVEGHADGDGDVKNRSGNQEESERRAEAVRGYLILRGIHCARLADKGSGYEQPRRSEDTKAGQDRNRRVEFIIIEIVDPIKSHEESDCGSKPQP
jgi:hypothetical protein